jgi:hypothetical protein
MGMVFRTVKKEDKRFEIKKPEEKVASKEWREWSVTRHGGSAIDLLCGDYWVCSAFDGLKTG